MSFDGRSDRTANSYAGEHPETFDAFLSLAERTMLRTSTPEIVHPHRYGEPCSPGCRRLDPAPPDQPAGGDNPPQGEPTRDHDPDTHTNGYQPDYVPIP